MPDDSYDNFMTAILQAARDTATKAKATDVGWFQRSQSTLAPIIEERNKLLHKVRQFTN